MKKIVLLLIILSSFVNCMAQQNTVVGKRVMAIDSMYVNGVWFKSSDIQKWNQGGSNVVYVDTLYKSNDTLYFTKSGQVYGIKMATSDSATFVTKNYLAAQGFLTSVPAQINSDWDAVSGVAQIFNKPFIPTNNNQLTNGSGYLTSVPAQSWSSIIGKPAFSTVATSGSYTDLTNKPTIPTNNNQLSNGAGYLTSIPDIYTKYTDTANMLTPYAGKSWVNSQGFLKSYTEVDPIWNAAKSGNTNISGGWTFSSGLQVSGSNAAMQAGTYAPFGISGTNGQSFFGYNFSINSANTAHQILNTQMSSAIIIGSNGTFYLATSPTGATDAAFGSFFTSRQLIASEPWVQSQNYMLRADLTDSLQANALDVLFPLSLNATNKTLSADTTMKDSSLVNYRQMEQYVSTNAPTYTLPTASITNLGGVKVDGSSITINGSGVISASSTGSGTVTSVGLSAPAGFSVSGSPVTTSGTLALSFASGYSLPTIANQTSWTNKVGPGDTIAMLAPYAFKTSLGQYKLNSDSTSLTGYVSHNSLNTTLAGKIIMNIPTDSISLSTGGIDTVLGSGNFTTKSLALGKSSAPQYTLDVNGSLHFNSGVAGDSSFIRSGRYPGGSPFVRLGVGVTNQGGVTEILSDSSGLYLITPAGGRISFNSNGTIQIPFYTNTDSLATFTTDANGSLILRSGVYRSIKTISATSYSLLPSDFTIIFAGTANTTFTLPNPTTCKGRIYRIENRATSGIDISVNYNLYENLTTTINSINSAAGYEIQSDGTNWWIIDTDTI